MNKIEYDIKIIINNIDIEPLGGYGYYSLNYSYIINGKKEDGYYEEQYDDWTKNEFLKLLKEGYALQIIMEQISEKNTIL